MSVERTGGQILVDELVRQSVDRVFTVAGESYLAVLDALYDQPSIQLVTCRHEAGATNMAEAQGKLTGRPGVCFVSRGPGASHASIACHVAQQDGTPLVLFIGGVNRAFIGRESLQELDFAAMFAPLSKLVMTLDDAARIPEVVGRAFRVAVSGRPGPVVVVLPQDVLASRTVPPSPRATAPPVPVQTGVPPAAVDQIGSLLDGAARPLVIVGGSGWTGEAAKGLRALVEKAGLPVAAAFRCQDILDNDSASYVGHLGAGIDPHLLAYARSADVVLVIGARLDSPTTNGYSLWDVGEPNVTLIHLFPDPDELGRVYQPAVSVACDPPSAVAALRSLEIEPQWDDSLRALRASYEAWRTPTEDHLRLDLGRIVAHLSATLDESAIIATGGGNYTGWVHRYFTYRQFGTSLGPRNGAMGYGIPAAVSAKLLHPEATVVAFEGDGCLMMTSHELATAAQYAIPIIVIVVNNGSFGTIRMHQEREYPGRVSGTTLENPDFVALAKAYGFHGQRVERTEDFPAAFEAAAASGLPSLIELVADLDDIWPGSSLHALQQRAADAPDGDPTSVME